MDIREEILQDLCRLNELLSVKEKGVHVLLGKGSLHSVPVDVAISRTMLSSEIEFLRGRIDRNTTIYNESVPNYLR